MFLKGNNTSRKDFDKLINIIRNYKDNLSSRKINNDYFESFVQKSLKKIRRNIKSDLGISLKFKLSKWKTPNTDQYFRLIKTEDFNFFAVIERIEDGSKKWNCYFVYNGPFFESFYK